MPGLEIRDLMQRAVLWPAIGWDAFGQPVVDVPVEIAVRWLTVRREVLDAKGATIALDAEAVTAAVVPMGSHLWLGTLAAWYSSGSAGQPDELCEVKLVNHTPDIKNRNQRTTLGLVRLHDSPGP